MPARLACPIPGHSSQTALAHTGRASEQDPTGDIGLKVVLDEIELRGSPYQRPIAVA